MTLKSNGTDLADRQAEVLAKLHAKRQADGRAPSMRELAKECGCSTSTAHRAVKALEGNGYVRNTSKARACEVLKDKPVLGTLK